MKFIEGKLYEIVKPLTVLTMTRTKLGADLYYFREMPTLCHLEAGKIFLYLGHYKRSDAKEYFEITHDYHHLIVHGETRICFTDFSYAGDLCHIDDINNYVRRIQ